MFTSANIATEGDKTIVTFSKHDILHLQLIIIIVLNNNK